MAEFLVKLPLAALVLGYGVVTVLGLDLWKKK